MKNKDKHLEILNKINNSEKVILKKSNQEYSFHLLQFGERGTYLDYSTIKYISSELSNSIKKIKEKYSILSPSPGGNPWGLTVANILKKDLKILRTEYIPNNQGTIKVENRYSSHEFYFKDILPKENIVIVDDVISSGNTLREIVKKLRNLGCNILSVQVIAVKGENYKTLQKELELEIRYLFEIK